VNVDRTAANRRENRGQEQGEGLATLAASTGRKKAGRGAAGANFEVDAFRTAGAMPNVGRVLSVGINPSVNIAASEMYTQKCPGIATGERAARWAFRAKIEMDAFFHSARIVAGWPPACEYVLIWGFARVED
jgi:hypothetical protein